MPSLELLDVIQHAKPDLINLDVEQTAKSVSKSRGSIKNYNMAMDHIDAYCSGHQKHDDLITFLRTHPNEEWHKHLEDVGTRLLEIFGKIPSKWHKTGRRPTESVAGLLVKPAIRGVWVADGKAFPCMINARSSVLLEKRFKLPFAARGVYESDVRDEINIAGPMIVDLGKEPSSGARANRVHFPTEAEMMSLEQFESILQRFSQALALAGITKKTVDRPMDLFRRREA